MGIYSVKNRRGFSLIEILVGVAVSAIILSGTAYLLGTTKNLEVKESLQNELDRAHVISLHSARSLKKISELIGLTDANGVVINTNLSNCLSGRALGINCSTFQKSQQTVLFNGSTTASKSAMGPSKVTSVMDWTLNCSTTACSQILANIKTTSALSVSKNLVERTSSTSFPGAFFGDVKKNDFSCAQASSQILQSIDFATQSVSCEPTSALNCALNSPASGWVASQCVALENAACPAGYGLESPSLWQGQSVCRAIASCSYRASVRTLGNLQWWRCRNSCDERNLWRCEWSYDTDCAGGRPLQRGLAFRCYWLRTVHLVMQWLWRWKQSKLYNKHFSSSKCSVPGDSGHIVRRKCGALEI